MTAPPVLLVHGFATSASRTWGDNGWLDLLADAGRSTIAPDLPGHGSAPRPHDPAAYADVAGTIAACLPDEPVDAIGFSYGARTLLSIASADPGRFSHLVVAGVGANLFRSEDAEPLARAIERETVPDHPQGAYFHQLARADGNDPVALAAFLRAPGPPISAEALARVSCPVLVVLGDRDFAGPADPLVDALPHARLVTLPNTDHFATPKNFAFLDAALEFVGAAP